LDTLSLAAILLFDEALVLVYFFSLGYIKERSLDEDADLLSGETRFLKSNAAFSLSCELQH
jgi:hypothetical protein